MKTSFLFSFSILFALEIFCRSPEVVIRGSQINKITSSIVNGQEYVLQIFLPAGFDKKNKKYPIVYAIDSQLGFPLLAALYGEQYFDSFIPEIIIV